jgi:spermidine/putrescine transport system substrate-binding protein
VTDRTKFNPVALAAREFSRRALLKTSIVVGAGAITAPWIVKDAFSSSGEVNFMGWAGYDFKDLFAAFTAKTGIKMNFVEEPDNNTIFAQSKLALQTGAVDCMEPTVDLVQQYLENDVIQPWDLTKISIDNYEPSLVSGEIGSRGEVGGKRYFLPSVWGTEALVYHKEQAPEVYGTASLADLFDPKFEGKVVLRAHSSLAAMGRLLDAQGKLPLPFMDGYKDDESMKKIWDVILAEAIKHKKNVVQFWSGENDAQGAFRTNGCTLGLCWDSTGYHLGQDMPVGYIAPKEGAFAWNQGYLLMKNAKNIEQAHEWAKFVSTPEGSAANAKAFAANPSAKGAIALADPSVTKFYQEAYPGDALSKLWWWPTQTSSFLKLRGFHDLIVGMGAVGRREGMRRAA